MTPDQVALLRLIKRSACILLALLHCDQPITARQLSNITAIDYTTTRTHLRGLSEHGLASRVVGGYLPTGLAAQLIPINSYPQENASYPQVYAHPVDNSNATIKNAEKPRFPKIKTRKNRAFNSTTDNVQIKNAIKPRFYPTKTRNNRVFDPLNTIIINNNNSIKELNNNNKPTKTRENRVPASPPPIKGEAGREAELWQTFAQYGILKNARTQKLEALPHITPALVKQTAETINKPFPQYAGLLIRALEQSADQPPAHPAGCTCPVCRRKYASGKYAKFINS